MNNFFDSNLSVEDIQVNLKKLIQADDLTTITFLLDQHHESMLPYLPFLFYFTCSSLKLNILKYLLNEFHIEQYVDIDKIGDNNLNFFQNGIINTIFHRLNKDKNKINLLLEQLDFLLFHPSIQPQLDLDFDNGRLLSSISYNGDVDILKYLYTSPKFLKRPNITIDDSNALITACQEGHLDIIKYLLTSPDLNEHANIYAKNHASLNRAFRKGHLHVIEYLLTSPELKCKALLRQQQPYDFDLGDISSTCYFDIILFLLNSNVYHIDNTYTLNEILTSASMLGNIELVEFLFNSPQLELNADINSLDGQQAFVSACCGGKLDMVKFLMFSDKLKDHINPHIETHIQGDTCVIEAYINKNNDVLNYLIYEFKIYTDPSQYQFLFSEYPELKMKLENRDLHKKLSQKLKQNQPIYNTSKI